MKCIAISLLFIFIFQLIALWPSFHLALFGDDWLGFWLYDRLLGPDSPDKLTFLAFFLSPYGSQTINQGIIYNIFGASSLPYYIISFIWRLVAAFTLFFLTYKLTKNRLSAFMAGSFFAVTSIGLDATNWVFNMIAYIGIIPLLFFIQFYFKTRETNKWLHTFIAFLFLFLAIIIVPTRMHGLLGLFLILEVIWVLIERTQKSLKHFLIRVSVFMAIILLIKNIGTSFANPEESVARFFTGMSTIGQMIRQNGQIEVFFYPITIFGNMIIPDTLWQPIQLSANTFLGSNSPLSKLTILVYASSILIGYFLLKNKEGTYRKPLIMLIFFEALFTLSLYLVRILNPINFSRLDYLGGTLVGGYSIILLSILVWNKLEQNNHRILILTGVMWSVAFFAMPWLFYPYIVYPTFHRYMIISSVGIGLMWGALNLLKINKPALIFLFIIQILIQAFASHDYLSTLALRRSRQISERIWNVLDKQLPKFEESDDFKVVYFASDNTNSEVVYNNVFFGFPPRMALKYNIRDSNKTPVALTTYPDLVSMAVDGQAFKAHGRPLKPIPLDQIYAFAILGDKPETIRVVNIRDEVIKDLEKRIEEAAVIKPQ